MRELKCFGSSDISAAILRSLLAILILYALVIIFPLISSIPHWMSGEFEYSIVTHWPFYLMNVVLVFLCVPLWRGSRYGSLVLVIISVSYIAYSLIKNYWPITHITYSVILLVIAYLSYCLANMKAIEQ